MAKPLDGIALQAYFRRLGFGRETQELLTQVRLSPPSRTPGAQRGNMPVWYPSKKMQCIIKAESAKVEFAFLLEAEHADDVLEFWDQPPPIPLEYRDLRGHLQRPLHTADYFVFRQQSAGYEECKPVEELTRLAQTQPNRYRQDDQGTWRCLPGEAFAAKHGLTYRVRASDQINWAAQDNWLYLDDYYQDLEKLAVPETDLDLLWQIVDEHPGLSLADLRAAAREVSSDRINIAIAQHALYVDLAAHRLAEPWRTPVWRSRHMALATASPQKPDQEAVVPLARSGKHALLTQAGRELLEQASETNLATAVFRNRVIHPEHYDDDEQRQQADAQAAVPARTKQRWRQRYYEAETRYGSGFLGLLPHYSHCGGNRKIADPVIKLIHEVLETHYDTVTQRPKRGAYGEYLKRSEEQHVDTVSERTFYAEALRHKTKYEQVVARQGTRAAYPFKDYVRESAKTMSRHGDYAWSLAHIDHTELDLMLCDSRTGQPLGKCWLTLLILAHPRRIAAYYLTFDEPSYRSCMMTLRLCVQRYGRLPSAIVVDGGPEFHSVYFEQLLALYRVRKHQRPAAEPRFGSPQERLFGTLDTEFLYHLLGNTQASREPRQMTRATDPRRQAVWTLPRLAERVQQWADEEYDTRRHPALGMTPREAYDLSIKRDGERLHKQILYDDTFLKATFPTTRKGAAKVEPGVGVRMNYLDYWCEAMRDPTVEGTQVKVRYDPFNVSVGYAYIEGKWRVCDCPYTEFAGCSERELQLLTEELRKRNRLTASREQVEITQKQLATFRRQNVEIETILRQQRHDRETRAALVVLEGGKKTEMAGASPQAETVSALSEDAEAVPARKTNPYDHLLVLKRIRLERENQ
jgi:putative transposase